MVARAPVTYKQRNYPSISVMDALTAATAIQDKAAGMPVERLTLAELVGRSPSSSGFKDLLLASRAFGFTKGGKNADTFELTALGEAATGADEEQISGALRTAVLNIPPFKTFLQAHDQKRVPVASAMKAFLTTKAAVPDTRAEECATRLLADAKQVGFIRNVSGNDYIDLRGIRPSPTVSSTTPVNDNDQNTMEVESGDEFKMPAPPLAVIPSPSDNGRTAETGASKPKKVFIAHGKNREPLIQLKAILDRFGVKYAVAVDEPNAGRPISAKVASLMRDECSSAIFIFTADELFFREDEQGNRHEVWRPSENVVYELGAAAILYDRRIVIFKEKRVSFPSDFSDLGYITFEADSLNMQTGDLFSELVALDILEVRAKG